MVKIHLSNQDLFAQKLTFFIFLEDNICHVYSLEVPRLGTSDEYLHHVFSLTYKIKSMSHNLATLRSWCYAVLVPGHQDK